MQMLRSQHCGELEKEYLLCRLKICHPHGDVFVRINSTANCRPSHEAINGKIFSLSGSDPRYPKMTSDLEALFHDYNCGHQWAIYHEGLERVFEDPLDGTGYTVEEARAAVGKQRRYENSIRKQKRVVEALKAAGQETTDANRRLSTLQRRLREHIEANSAVCRRERHREQLYDTAQRMKKKARKAARKANVLSIGKAGNIPSNSMKVVGWVNTADEREVAKTIDAVIEGIKGKEVEHAVVIQNDGKILHSVGDVSSVTTNGSCLDNAIILHNHPTQIEGSVSFGEDDYCVLQENEIRLMIAVNEVYKYSVKKLRKLDISYNEAWRDGVIPFYYDDQQHNVMEWLAKNGYVEYKRETVRSH